MRSRKCIILLTKDSLGQLSGCKPSDIQEKADFLNLLGSGDWADNPADSLEDFSYWRCDDVNTQFCTCKVAEEDYAVWELASSFDLFGYTNAVFTDDHEMKVHYRPHVILHHIGAFPGLPGRHMSILDEEFEPPEDLSDMPNRLDRPAGTEEIDYSREMYILPESLILDLLSRRQAGLPIQLTEEQAFVLNLRGPVLMSGEAGSGKTTVIITWLLNNLANGVEKQLFVTFSDRLTEMSGDTFREMLPARAKPKSHGVQFLTYRELLLDVSERGEISHRFDPDREMTFDKFCRGYARSIRGGLDPVLIWDEIRSVIKGSCVEPERVLIDYEKYESLNEKRGQSKVPDILREKYYEEAAKYQRYLEREALWDAVDLARACLEKVVYAEKFDRIACDEVQDLAPCEIRLLTELVSDRDISGMFFTGDMAQVINPSGFRWATLKGLLGEFSGRHDIMDAHSLKRNFRSTREIVQLANHAFNLREEMVGCPVDRIHQRSNVRGEKPQFLGEDPISVLKQCENVRSDMRMILVKNAEEKERLIEVLGDAQYKAPVLTVDESKGLERDGVLLWNFFLPRSEISKDFWSDVFIPEKRSAFHKLVEQGKRLQYGLEYEFNLLHVGLTRARRGLLIYDEDETANVLNMDGAGGFVEVVEQIDEKRLRSMWETDPPSAMTLEDTARELRDKNRSMSDSFYKKAAARYAEDKAYREAARCYFKAVDYENAASCYKEAGDEIAMRESLAMHHKSNSRWKESAQEWENRAELLGGKKKWGRSFVSYENAQRMLHKAGMLEEQARIAELRAGCAFASGDNDLALRGLEALDDAIELWQRKKKNKESLQLTNLAIGEAEGLNKSHVEGLVRGYTVDEWIPELHMRRARFEAELRNPKTAAEVAMGASRLFMRLQEKRPEGKYWKREKEAMENAVSWYVKASDKETALNVRYELLKLVKTYSKPPEIRLIWRELIALLLDLNDAEEAMKQVDELARFLVRRGLEDKAIEELEAHEKWCIEQGLGTHQVRTLKLIAAVFSDAGEGYESALVHLKIGGMLEEMGQLGEASESYHQAGSKFLDAGWTDKSLESYEKAGLCIEIQRTPLQAGKFFLDKVILSKLLPGNHVEHALRLADITAEAFATDLDSAERHISKGNVRLAREIDDLAERRTTEKNFKAREIIDEAAKELKNTRGWAVYILALAFDSAIQKGARSKKVLRRRDKYYDEAMEVFDDTDNVDMFNRAQSAKNAGDEEPSPSDDIST